MSSRSSPLQFFILIVVCSIVGLWSCTLLLSDEETSNRLMLNIEWMQEGTPVKPIRNDQDLCRYEGHCPIGYTCVVNQGSSQGGLCEPYIFNDAPRLSETDPCIQACMDELRWEDHHQFARRPEQLEYFMSTGSGRPNGCRIGYQRVDQAPNEFIEEDAYREWLKKKSARRIVRVDPVYNKGNSNVTWTALCFNACQSDADCGLGFVCDLQGGKTCRHDDLYWTPTAEEKHDMVIVSGATQDYFEPLKNLAASLCFWAPEHKLVVYNLGLEDDQLDEIRSWSNLLDLKWAEGIPSTYPPHVHVGKKYAWKPIAINESLHEYKAIFWMDAGSSFTGPLDPVIRITKQTGIFLVKGQDTNMTLRSNKKTYEWFKYSKDTYRSGPHFAGGIQGHILPSRYVDTIVKPNAACAMDIKCIEPAGASLYNHRYDQTVLSILAYQQDVQAPHHTEYLAGEKRQISNNLTDPSFMFIYTARGKERRYSYLGICNITK